MDESAVTIDIHNKAENNSMDDGSSLADRPGFIKPRVFENIDYSAVGGDPSLLPE